MDQARLVSKVFEKESEMKQIAFENFCYLVAGFAVISAWRGIWMWFDLLATKFPIYIFHKDVTPLVGCLTSYILIVMAKLSNSLPYKGCEIDGELKNGEGLIVCTDYFIDFITNMKKQQQDENQKEESNDKRYAESNHVSENNISKEDFGESDELISEMKMPTRASRAPRRRVRAIEHANNILAKDASLMNGTINYELSEEEMKNLDDIE